MTEFEKEIEDKLDDLIVDYVNRDISVGYVKEKLSKLIKAEIKKAVDEVECDIIFNEVGYDKDYNKDEVLREKGIE